MRALYILFLTSLIFSLFSCPIPEEEPRPRKPGRKRESPRRPKKPQKPAQPSAPQVEEAMFPFYFTPSHTSLSVKSNDNERMTISAEPSDEPIELKASLSGQVFLTSSNGAHTLILSHAPSNRAYYFELEEARTTLTATGGNIKQGNTLAKTTAPLTWYVKKNDKLTVFCFPLEALLREIQRKGLKTNIIKEYPDHPDCG